MIQHPAHTHVLRQSTPNGTALTVGMFVQGVGFLMFVPKSSRSDAETGVYRIVRNLGDAQIATIAEAERLGWGRPAPMLRHRRQFEAVAG